MQKRAEEFAREKGAEEIALPSIRNEKIRRIAKRYGYEPEIGRRLVKKL